MPISYRVDHDAKVVVAAGHGEMSDDDVFGYQREVWSRTDLNGYSELIDMSRVTKILLPSADRVRDLAELSASMDDPGSRTRFAVVASDDLAYGLGRMFQTYKRADSRTTKEVGVFRTMEEALAFLGVDHPLAPPEL